MALHYEDESQKMYQPIQLKLNHLSSLEQPTGAEVDKDNIIGTTSSCSNSGFMFL